MTTNFPASLDSYSVKVDDFHDVLAEHINNPQDAIVAIETYLRGARHEENLLADSLTHEASWLAGTTFNDLADDNYGPTLWNILNDANAPDVSGTAGGSTDPFTRYLKITLDATTRVGAVQFITAEKTRPYRGQVVSLSADLWATGITAVRMAVAVWTSIADTLTSDIVSSWAANPTLVANWAFIGTPAGITISSTRARFSVQNLTIPTNAVNLAVFIWTPSQEASTDALNIARVKLEPGAAATEFVARDPDEELAKISYFLQKIDASSNTINIGVGSKSTSTIVAIIYALDYPMRATPALVHNVSAYTASSTPGTTTIALFNQIAVGPFTLTGALSITIGAANKAVVRLTFTAGTSWDGTVGDLACLRVGPDVVMLFDARL